MCFNYNIYNYLIYIQSSDSETSSKDLRQICGVKPELEIRFDRKPL